MKKGDIVLIPFPFTNLSGTKNRPALVLAANELDITVSFITTQLKWGDVLDVKLESTPLNGLKKTSLVRIGKLATIDKDLVIGKLGSLSPDEIRKVNNSLKKIFRIN